MTDDLLQAADSFRLGTAPSDEDVDRANFLIDRLSARLATEEAKLAKAVELLGKWRLASAGHISVRSVIDKHDAVIAELGEGDDLVKHLRGGVRFFEPCGSTDHYGTNCLMAEAADRIKKLEAENHLLKTSGIAEVAARNPNVLPYMSHWETRAEAAEAKLALAISAILSAYECHMDGDDSDVGLILGSALAELGEGDG